MSKRGWFVVVTALVAGGPRDDGYEPGEGDGLADGRPDFLADGREWRTPPLWGIGLSRVVNGHELYLHDGRARGLAEAILWRGGEASAARERFRALTLTQRTASLAFLGSL